MPESFSVRVYIKNPYFLFFLLPQRVAGGKVSAMSRCEGLVLIPFQRPALRAHSTMSRNPHAGDDELDDGIPLEGTLSLSMTTPRNVGISTQLPRQAGDT